MLRSVGCLLDSRLDYNSRQSDYQTFDFTFNSIIKSHYSFAEDSIAIRLVPCIPICASALAMLAAAETHRYFSRKQSEVNFSAMTHSASGLSFSEKGADDNNGVL